MRQNLINAIIDLSGDELQYNDLIEIAKEDIEKLIERLVNIANYYKNN